MQNNSRHNVASSDAEVASVKSALVWIAVIITLVTILQIYIPYPVDDDTAYHFSVARLIREHGILNNFVWTRFSWQFDHYADKEFLFHLLFIPFLKLGFNNASRAVGVICGSLMLSTMYLILRAERVRLAEVWAILPLGASIFVYRFAQVRPHLLSITLALIVVWAYSRGRYKILAFAAVIYPLTYVAFWQIPLILIVAAELARLLSCERFAWKPVVILTAGLVVGVMLHPNTLYLLQINWIHMSDILFRNAWGEHVEFNLGEEFEPFNFYEMARFLTLTIMMAVAGLVLAWMNRREYRTALGIVIAALLFGILTLRTNRFLEYFVPFSVLSLAISSRKLKNNFIAPALLVLSVIYTLFFGIEPLKSLGTYELKNWRMEPEITEYFSQQIPVGSNVFTCGWEYTGSLLLNLPGRYYIIALDPTLMFKSNPLLYGIWYNILLNAPPDSAEIVRTRFKSRFVVCQDYPPLHQFFTTLAADKKVTVKYSNGKWVLFDLGESVK